VAKGLFLTRNGQVLVEYGKRRVAISPAQYKANGYRPLYDKLPAEPPPRPRKGLAQIETVTVKSAPPIWSTMPHSA
jgi:hypothetical protein